MAGQADRELLEALGLRRPGAVVSLVGAGGKTSLALWLMAEGRAAGWPVLFTTTTHIQEPVLQPGEGLLLREEPGFEEALDRCVREGTPAFAAAGRADLPVKEEPGEPIAPGRFRDWKLRGLAPEEVDALAQRYPAALFLVEADGARHRLLKAPAEHEPRVPQCTTHLLTVAAADAVGKPLEPAVVHRPARLAALLGAAEGVILSAEMVAQALVHPLGGLKDVPPRARVIPVITLVEEPWTLGAARDIAQRLWDSGRADGVVVAALRPAWQVVEVVP